MPRVHVYPRETFIITHAPELGERGHVHSIEFDQIIDADYLVMTHGPLNPAVDPPGDHADLVGGRPDQSPPPGLVVSAAAPA